MCLMLARCVRLIALEAWVCRWSRTSLEAGGQGHLWKHGCAGGQGHLSRGSCVERIERAYMYVYVCARARAHVPVPELGRAIRGDSAKCCPHVINFKVPHFVSAFAF